MDPGHCRISGKFSNNSSKPEVNNLQSLNRQLLLSLAVKRVMKLKKEIVRVIIMMKVIDQVVKIIIITTTRKSEWTLSRKRKEMMVMEIVLRIADRLHLLEMIIIMFIINSSNLHPPEVDLVLKRLEMMQ